MADFLKAWFIQALFQIKVSSQLWRPQYVRVIPSVCVLAQARALIQLLAKLDQAHHRMEVQMCQDLSATKLLNFEILFVLQICKLVLVIYIVVA